MKYSSIVSRDEGGDEHVDEVGDDGGDETADGVGEDRLGRQLPVAERVEHRCVRAQVAAPAHADRGEDGYGVAVYPSLVYEVGHKAERRAHRAERRDREGHEVRIGKPEQPFEYEVDLACKPRQQRDSFVGRAGISAGLARRTERQNHHERRDDQHAGDDGEADVYTGPASVKQRVEHADERGLFMLMLFFLDFLVFPDHILREVMREVLDYEILHDARRYDTAAERPEESYHRLPEISLTHHEHHHQQTHAERRAEIGERYELEFLEV